MMPGAEQAWGWARGGEPRSGGVRAGKGRGEPGGGRILGVYILQAWGCLARVM